MSSWRMWILRWSLNLNQTWFEEGKHLLFCTEGRAQASPRRQQRQGHSYPVVPLARCPAVDVTWGTHSASLEVAHLQDGAPCSTSLGVCAPVEPTVELGLTCVTRRTLQGDSVWLLSLNHQSVVSTLRSHITHWAKLTVALGRHSGAACRGSCGQEPRSPQCSAPTWRQVSEPFASGTFSQLKPSNA